MSKMKYGGPWAGKSKCPKCGIEFDDYRAGSWDWQPHLCVDCKMYELNFKTNKKTETEKEMKLSELLCAKAAFDENSCGQARFNLTTKRLDIAFHEGAYWQSKQTKALLTKVGAVLDAADTLESQDDQTGAYKSNDHQNLKIAIAELKKELTDDQA